VLVTDGDERAALAAARSLAAAGHRVLAAAPRRSLAGSARGVVPVRLAPSPLAEPAAFAAAVADLARRHRVDVLLPMVDASVEALLAERDTLPDGTVLPFPSLAVYRRAADKHHILAAAAAAGLGVPRTHLLAAADAVPPPLPFPVVIKPHRSVVANGNGRRQVTVHVARDARELAAGLAALPPAAYPVLLQEHVPGEGIGVFLLRWQGATVAAFAHRRLREKPPAGGVSVYRESAELPPDLRAAAERLLVSLDWEGVAMIECRRDARTGRAMLMEINGRFWGSLQLAIDAGVDFPRLLVACATGKPVPAPRAWRVGVRSRWWWGDVDHLYLRLRHGPRRLATLAAFCRHRPGIDRFEVERLTDPLPGLLEAGRRLRGLTRLTVRRTGDATRRN
jgi:predicted ATP-grasp superfamily ATP-dependent carboligase